MLAPKIRVVKKNVYIFHSENTDQFLSRTDKANTNQDTIRLEPYCPFDDSPSKALFCYLKYF